MYLHTLKQEVVSAKTIGAVVMNCNPFTFGHQYLIQTAYSMVDFLYIFIVEEDVSEFTFEERFHLAKANLSQLPNVKILPSGQYIISKITFPEYFKKETMQTDGTVSPANDAHIFARYIAPLLSIKIRFVGEEPTDTVTLRYNEAMKAIFPDYGIHVVEIPRLLLASGIPVSATQVRKFIQEGNVAACRDYLPNTTYEFVNKNFSELVKRMTIKRENSIAQ